jgi:hypothetical protein
VTTNPTATIAVPQANEILARVRKDHPRVMATSADFTALRQLRTQNTQYEAWYQKLRAAGEKTLAAPPSKYEIPDGLRLLATSRRVLERVSQLAMLYQLDGERRWAERAWSEMEAAANFPDWNPRHFLDTAEMTHAFAIGYDWLYNVWTPEQRTVLRNAMVTKGLDPTLEAYRGDGAGQGWWVKSEHNWNQVCHGGIGTGALALADEEPQRAGEILTNVVRYLPLAMKHFAPDGAWNEGPGYWSYATQYNVAILAAMQTSLGTDYGLSQIPGFSQTGNFPVYVAGPVGKTFNYADSGDRAGSAAQLFWLARRFNQPGWANYQMLFAERSPNALDMLWGASWLRPQVRPQVPTQGAAFAEIGKPIFPLDRYFRDSEVVTMRSAWNDPDATFVAFKAGDNKANHSHLDLGTFVLDALGHRWALDLAGDNYSLPGYFGAQRWDYYRLRTEGHNTLVLNPTAKPEQDPRAASQILRFDTQPNASFAVADLTQAYAPQAMKVQRGVMLLGRKQVLIQDEIEAAAPSDAWWFMHTQAEIKIEDDGTSAILTQGKARLMAKILLPVGTQFAAMDARPLPSSPNPKGQDENKGVRKLSIHLPGVSSTRIAVLLVPLRENEFLPTQTVAIRPLERW